MSYCAKPRPEVSNPTGYLTDVALTSTVSMYNKHSSSTDTYILTDVADVWEVE